MLSISQIHVSGGPFDLIERDGEDPRTLPFLDRRAAPVLLLRERQCRGVIDKRGAGHAVRGCRNCSDGLVDSNATAIDEVLS
jgi:hypothetical protein